MVMSLSFNEYVNLPVTMSARLAIAWPRRLCLFYPCHRFLLFFQARLSLQVRIARTKKLALDTDAGVASRFFLSCVKSACCTCLYPMKLIIALKDQEVKRYVVISLIHVCKFLI
jgi:hypothetical protein